VAGAIDSAPATASGRGLAVARGLTLSSRTTVAAAGLGEPKDKRRGHVRACKCTMNDLPKLDRIDLRILSHLQKNGRIANVDLAEAVGLSASPCLMRLKRLEKAGYITGYSAHVNLQKLGETITVFTEVTLSDHRRNDFGRFEAYVRNVEEIIECHLVSGGYDYLLKFVARSVGHYQSVIEHLLEQNIGIDKYFSYIVIKSVFVKNHLPLEDFFKL
jgi:DNA-binding Lrp family transcriptional regulator